MSKRNGENESEHKNKRRSVGPVPSMFQIFNGEVASVKDYGLFVKIPETNRQGLVHKSQMSRSKVDDPSEIYARGEYVYCKVISVNDDGEKIGLAMKTVNQTTGRDEDPNNIELSQDEKKRKQFGGRHERQKIVLDAVYDTTCKKCGGKGHLAQDCFKTGEGSYDLIPDLDDYMQSMVTQQPEPSVKKKKDRKKGKKAKEKEKQRKKKRCHSSSSSSDSSDSDHKHKKRRKKQRSKHSSTSDSCSDSDDDNRRKKKHKDKKKKAKHKRRHRSSSSSSSSD